MQTYIQRAGVRNGWLLAMLATALRFRKRVNNIYTYFYIKNRNKKNCARKNVCLYTYIHKSTASESKNYCNSNWVKDLLYLHSPPQLLCNSSSTSNQFAHAVVWIKIIFVSLYFIYFFSIISISDLHFSCEFFFSFLIGLFWTDTLSCSWNEFFCHRWFYRRTEMSKYIKITF